MSSNDVASTSTSETSKCDSSEGAALTDSVIAKPTSDSLGAECCKSTKSDLIPDLSVSSGLNHGAALVNGSLPSTGVPLTMRADMSTEQNPTPAQNNEKSNSIIDRDVLVITGKELTFEKMSEDSSSKTLVDSSSEPASYSALHTESSSVVIKLEPTDSSSVVIKLEPTNVKETAVSFHQMQSVEMEIYSSDSTDTSSDEEIVVGNAGSLNHDEDIGDGSNIKNRSKVSSKRENLGALVRGELTIYDLPPIEDLKIDIDEKVELCELGAVMSIVECLVVVKSNRGIPALDEETALFMKGRKYIGKIFETFGPVISPFYSVRFNSIEDIKNSEIKAGDKILFAPKEDRPLTSYVFLDRLKTLKGSDASWAENLEPPEQFIDYSDDEQERQAKAKKKAKNRKPESTNPSESDQSDNSKHFRTHQRSLVEPRMAYSSPQAARHRNPPSIPPRPHGGYAPNRAYSRPPGQFGGPPPCGQYTRGPPPHQMWGEQGHYWPRPPVRYPHSSFTPPAPSGFPPMPLPGFGNAPPAFHAGWQGYGGSWTDQDSNYYSEQPKKLDVSFVDTRYIQQPTQPKGGDTSHK